MICFGAEYGWEIGKTLEHANPAIHYPQYARRHPSLAGEKKSVLHDWLFLVFKDEMCGMLIGVFRIAVFFRFIIKIHILSDFQ